MYFLRWTSDPDQDVRRNFSGNMQCWFDSEQEAMKDYNERIADGYNVPYPPRKDITTAMWNSEPEWGLSGYGFKNKTSFIKAMKNIKEIAWHHSESLHQDLCLFSSEEFIIGDGFDGEDVFKNAKYFPIDININTTFEELLNSINTLNETRLFIKNSILKQINSVL